MATTLKQVMQGLPSRQRAQVEARAAALVAEELTLQGLRKAQHKTQVEIAKKLKMGQEGISRLERNSDMMVSTLRRYVAAMGGRLKFVAEMPSGHVELSGFADLYKVKSKSIAKSGAAKKTA
jgi:hypothetical protein